MSFKLYSWPTLCHESWYSQRLLRNVDIFFLVVVFLFWRNYANHFDVISVIGGDFTIKITTNPKQ